METMAPLLAGLKVIDCGTFIFGPAAATVLSDFGADVIKVEPPGIGDPYRYLQWMPPLPNSEHFYGWLLTNRNKRGIVLDLKKDEGREVLHGLVAGADVFVTNYHPSVLRAFGATYEDLAPLNDRLVYAHATGYGEHGAEVEKPGYDATAWWARSGLRDAVREADAAPAMSVPGMGDHPSAMALFSAILLGLMQRERNGKGTKVSSSLVANGAWANGYLLQAVLVGAKNLAPVTRRGTPNALVNRYRTRDDRWIFLAIVQEIKDWGRLPLALSRPELLDDPRFDTPMARRENVVALIDELDAIFASNDLAHWREALDRHDITFGIIAHLPELDEDPLFLANRIFRELRLADGGVLKTVDSPLNVAGAEKVPPRPAPERGQHSDEILAELGYGPDEVARLREKGVLG
jgi:formyl-CoA transferase